MLVANEINNELEWAPELRDFGRLFGFEFLYELGLKALSYPPTWVWIVNPNDVMQVDVFQREFEIINDALTRSIVNGTTT